jgi:hypothetical protein
MEWDCREIGGAGLRIFSDIVNEQNFRYSYLEEKTAWTARCPVG